MTVADFLKIVTAEIESFIDTDYSKREYLILRCEELFDEYFQPIDLPGPDAIIDPILRSAIRPLVGRIFDEVLRRIIEGEEVTFRGTPIVNFPHLDPETEKE
ncbi:MAG TPA: hypothetical protein ENH65_06960 [Candidatus Aminicenantes bacterium]|nr:hypothetical protein [Candidatus Aminicenantes bacterium]